MVGCPGCVCVYVCGWVGVWMWMGGCVCGWWGADLSGGVPRVVWALGLLTDKQAVFVPRYLQPSPPMALCDPHVVPLIRKLDLHRQSRVQSAAPDGGSSRPGPLCCQSELTARLGVHALCPLCGGFQAGARGQCPIGLQGAKDQREVLGLLRRGPCPETTLRPSRSLYLGGSNMA